MNETTKEFNRIVEVWDALTGLDSCSPAAIFKWLMNTGQPTTANKFRRLAIALGYTMPE